MLVDINLNRNRVTEEGIESLLDIVHQIIRIENFECCYGNCDPSGAQQAFKEEVNANKHIKKNLKNEMNIDVTTRFDILNHPDFKKR